MGILLVVIAIPFGGFHDTLEQAKRGGRFDGRFHKVVAVSH